MITSTLDIHEAVSERKSVTILGVEYVPRFFPRGNTVSSNGTAGDYVTDTKKIHLLRMALYQAVIWNEDYKHINNIPKGDPGWVSMAHHALIESR